MEFGADCILFGSLPLRFSVYDRGLYFEDISSFEELCGGVGAPIPINIRKQPFLFGAFTERF